MTTFGAVAGPNADSTPPVHVQDVPSAGPQTEGLQLHNPPTTDEIARQQADLLDRMFARLQASKSAEAAAVLQEAVHQLWTRSGSPTVDVLLRQARKAMGAKEYELAGSILDAVNDLSPDFAEGWKQRATLHYLQGENDRAIDALERVLELEPRHFDALVALGVVRESINDRAGALQAFRTALEINPFLKDAEAAVERLEKKAGQPI